MRFHPSWRSDSMGESDTPLVLLVEDEEKHREAVVNYLGTHGIRVEPFASADAETMVPFRVRYPSCRVAVVDLGLPGSEGSIGGSSLIEEVLWPMDRTAVFVVYSALLVPGAPSNAAVAPGPHCLFVRKVVTNGAPTTESLEELLQNVRVAIESVGTELPEARLDIASALSAVTDFDREVVQLRPVEIRKIIESSVQRSIDVLTDLVTAARPLRTLGGIASHLGVGVYGSCGRLEMRSGSDVEMSAVVGPLPSDIDRGVAWERALHMWNRVACHLDQSPKYADFEGSELFRAGRFGMLELEDVPQTMEDRFLPIISVDAVLRPERRDAHASLLRTLQIIGELRPVFNPAVIERFQASLVSKLWDKPKNPADFLLHPVLAKIIGGFLDQTVPDRLQTEKDIKNGVLRVGHALGLPLAAIRMAIFEDMELKDGADWRHFFASLAEPTPIKAMRLALAVRRDPKTSQQLRRVSQETAQKMAAVYGRFIRDFDGASMNELKQAVVEIKEAGNGLVNLYSEIYNDSLFAYIAPSPFFDLLPQWSKWSFRA
jgi:hypothetical protein